MVDTNLTSTLSMLERLLLQDKTVVSAATIDCLKRLKYTPGINYKTKPNGDDLSPYLEPVTKFVEAFLASIDKTPLTTNAGDNERAFRSVLTAQLPEISASSGLVPFSTSWGIEVKDDGDLQCHQEQKFKQELDNSAYEDDEQAKDRRKEISQELDIFNSALHHRIARWTATFPRSSSTEPMWPLSFNEEEREAIKGFVRKYMNKHFRLWGLSIDKELEVGAVMEMFDDDDFPVPLAKSAVIIQAVLFDLRCSRFDPPLGQNASGRDIAAASNGTASKDPSAIDGQRTEPVPVSRGKRPFGRAADNANEADANENGGVEQADLLMHRHKRQAFGTSIKGHGNGGDDAML